MGLVPAYLRPPMWKRPWFRRTTYALFGIPIGFVLLTSLFMNLHPAFGGSPSKADRERFAASAQYTGGKFHNSLPTTMDLSLGDYPGMLVKFFRPDPGREPAHKLKVLHPDPALVARPAAVPRLTWFGHSAFLLQLDSLNILLDPMFGPVPAPVTWLGRPRFTEGLPIAVDSLPHIDAIFFSHDHYDHLDHGSILKLKDRTDAFFVPLGVGAHLRAWGVPEERIHELDWWQETTYQGLDLAFAPARHFSGRGLMDRFSTLWGSWVIKGRTGSIYFSGDGGYGPHFAEIGERYGPFDLALMECGQYNELWAQIHMMPEETARAAMDVRAKHFMPIHWGSFALAMHTWTDPVVRVVAAAQELGVPITTPRIGEVLDLGGNTWPSEPWWAGL